MNDTCICENTPTVWRLTGVTRTLRLRIFNPDGTPLDLTGRTVAVTIARDNSEFSYAPGFVIEGDDDNVVKFEWPANKQGAGDYTINVTTTDGSGNVDRVNWHGPTGIRLVDFSFMVRGEDALGVTSEANIGLDGTFTMNGTGMSAYDEWLAEGHTGTPEGFIAWLRQPATDAASAAEAQMGQIQERADADHTRAGNDHTTAGNDHTTAGQDHTRAGNDHTTATDDHRLAAADHSTATDDHTLAASDHGTAAEDHRVAGIDHGTAADDHTRAGQDHQTASDDHTQAGSDHTRAGEDHNRAGDDHQTASSDHTRAGEDHTTAGNDHSRAEQDHTTAGEDHTRAEQDHQTWANKADKDTDAVEDNLAKFDPNGNPIDAGYSAARIHRDLGYNATQRTIVLSASVTGKYVKCSTRAATANANFNISAPFDVEACSELLIKTGFNPSDQNHAALDISIIAIYEEMERTRTVQAKNDQNQPLYYEVDEDGNPTSEQTTEVTPYPVYTTETYTESRYLPNNEDRFVAIPDSGYYVANIPQSCKCVISYKPGVTDLNVIVVKHGALANLASQIFGIYEHRTMSEAVVSLALRLDAVEKRLGQPGNILCGTVDAVEYTKLGYPQLVVAVGAPAANLRPTYPNGDPLPADLPWDGIPPYIGHMYLDMTPNAIKLYFAKGISAISDYIPLN